MSGDKDTKFHVKPEWNVSRETLAREHCYMCSSSALDNSFQLHDYSVSSEVFCIQKCTECGFRQTSPIPKDLDPYYDSPDYISHSKTTRGIINKLYHLAQGYNLWYKYSIMNSVSPGNEWLDYGCGAGDFLLFARSKGKNVHGVEPHSESRRRLSEQSVKVKTPDAYYAESSMVEAISMWHVLEHVEDPLTLLKKHHSNLTENGVLLIALPNPDSHDAAHYKDRWAAYDVPRHLWHFRESDIKKLAQKSGFAVQDVKALHLDAFYISMLSEKYRNGNLLAALWQAFKSNFIAWRKKRPWSSQIYILSKKGH